MCIFVAFQELGLLDDLFGRSLHEVLQYTGVVLPFA